MPRKTLALIAGLVLVTIVLFVIALRSNNQPQPSQQTNLQSPSPTSPAHTVLSLLPNPVSIGPGQQGSVDVNINTSDNAVTAVQLEIAYDPTIVSNVQVTPGPLFENPVILINKNDPTSGRITYAFGITPNKPTVNGQGVVASISFTAKNVPGKQSQLAILPSSLVTARGVASSVLKTSTGTIINVSGTAAGGANGSAVQPQTQQQNVQSVPQTTQQSAPQTAKPATGY